jgi:hypothetical protein
LALEKYKLKIQGTSEHWWLTPVILATQKADIMRITIRSQPLGK